MRKKKTKHVILDKKKFALEMYLASKPISDMVASTMTSSGKYISLPDGTTTNDGATIVQKLHDMRPTFFDEHIKNKSVWFFLEKLIEATEKTDELAGDGTSATTLMTKILTEYVHWSFHDEKNTQEVIGGLELFEKKALTLLNKLKKDLVTEDDYKKLAIVSTKDEDLGSLIGEAIFKAGTNAAIQLEQATKKTEDYVEYETHFTILSSLFGYGMPEEGKGSEVIIVDGPVMEQTAFLNRSAEYAFGNNKNLIIVCTQVGETSIEFVRGANQANEGKGSLVLVEIPQPASKHVTQKDLLKDVASYVGTDIYVSALFNESKTLDDVQLGTIDEFRVDKHMTVFVNKEQKESTKQRIEILKMSLDEINKDIEVEKAKILKGRINMLSGNTVKLFVYANNSSALQTKVYRVQDAVKATQFALGNGYVNGACSFYRELAKDEDLKKLDILISSMEANIFVIVGKDYGPSDSERDYKEGIIIDRKTGDVSFGNLYNNGIIDSAKVIENVIKNSVSIAKEFAMIGTRVIEVEEDE